MTIRIIRTIAGRNQIIEELGEGGMGKVYKALDSLQEALLLEPGNLTLRLYKARLLLAMQRYEAAENEISTIWISLIKTYLYTYPYLVNNRDFYLLREEKRFQELLGKQEILHQGFLTKFGDL